MKLKDQLYNILSAGSDNSFLLSLDRDCVIYKAHFPGMPVTPGVCIIQMASELLEELTGHRLRLTEVVNAKFIAVINPDDTPQITYRFTKIAETDDGLKVAVIVEDTATLYAKLSLVYRDK